MKNLREKMVQLKRLIKENSARNQTKQQEEEVNELEEKITRLAQSNGEKCKNVVALNASRTGLWVLLSQNSKPAKKTFLLSPVLKRRNGKENVSRRIRSLNGSVWT